MSYDVGEAADTFFDKWLPAFSESMLKSGWADRFHREITAALLEARAAAFEEAAKVCDAKEIERRLVSEAMGPKPDQGHPSQQKDREYLLDKAGRLGGESVAAQLAHEIRIVATKERDGGEGAGSRGSAGTRIETTEPLPYGTPRDSAAASASSTPSSPVPKYVCPMKRPNGEPKTCGSCASVRRDAPGECFCCEAKLILSTPPKDYGLNCPCEKDPDSCMIHAEGGLADMAGMVGMMASPERPKCDCVRQSLVEEHGQDVWLPHVPGCPAIPPEPLGCLQCGKDVEEQRRCYAVPVCYECLPPPPPLPRARPPA